MTNALRNALKTSFTIAAFVTTLYTIPYLAREVANNNTQRDVYGINNTTTIIEITHKSYNLNSIQLSRAKKYPNKIIGEKLTLRNTFDTKVITLLDGYDYSKDGLVDIIKEENTNFVKTKQYERTLYRNIDYETHKPEFDKADKLLKDTKEKFKAHLY